MPGFIASQIARVNRNYALVALALAAVAAAIGFIAWNSISGVVMGPRAVSAQELASLQSQLEPYKGIVRVSGSEVRGSFYRANVRRGKTTGTLYCWLLKVGDAQVVVESWTPPTAGLTAVGHLQVTPANIYRAATAYQAAGRIYPLLVDTRDWKANGWVALIYGLVLASVALVIVGVLLWWSSDPSRHPVRRAVLRLGDLEATAMQIDAEMQAELQSFGTVHLGQTVLVYAPSFSFDVVRIENITSARTAWLRKGKSNALFLVMDSSDGRSLKWQISQKYGDALLASVCTVAHLQEPAPASVNRIELRIGSKS